MSGDVAVVWLSPEGTAPSDAAHALQEWARARGVRLASASEVAPAATLPVDTAVGDRVEKELARAHDAIAALDADAAERALARAEASLRDHPELPQAAWLRAEVERSWAARFSRIEPRDDARAAEAWRRAWALDGGRVAGIGETDVGPPKRLHATIVVDGARARPIVVRLDGVELAAAGGPTPDGRVTYSVEIGPAEHQLVAYADGQPVFASWIAVPAGGPVAPIEIQLGDGGVCTREAFASVSRDDDRVLAPGVSCPRWVAAVPLASAEGRRSGSILVAQCARSTCGPLLEWRVSPYGESGPPQALAPRRPWPAWATWTLVGVTAAAAAAVGLVATGVLEARPVEPRFVAGGARVE